MVTGGRKIRLLIVDDSAMVRRILADSVQSEPDIEVVGTAPDPIAAEEMIARHAPDVLTLDVEMPHMNGLDFLRKLMRSRPIAVIMISSLTQQGSSTAVEALAEGAVEVLGKPHGPYSVGDFRFSLAQKVRNAAAARVSKRDLKPAVQPRSGPAVRGATEGGLSLIAIGASTGGTEAIEQIFRALPPWMPPIVAVQHIPAGFSKAFADRLNRLCSLEVREATGGEIIQPGLALLAPGNFHMRLARAGGRYRVSIDEGPRVCYQRPSVDVLFESIAAGAPSRAAALLLTGMGSDGAAGMKRLRALGVRTIAQDEQSCAVFGMPREAIRIGGVDEVLPLDRMAQRLITLAAGRAAG